MGGTQLSTHNGQAHDTEYTNPRPLFSNSQSHWPRCTQPAGRGASVQAGICHTLVVSPCPHHPSDLEPWPDQQPLKTAHPHLHSGALAQEGKEGLPRQLGPLQSECAGTLWPSGGEAGEEPSIPPAMSMWGGRHKANTADWGESGSAAPECSWPC